MRGLRRIVYQYVDGSLLVALEPVWIASIVMKSMSNGDINAADLRAAAVEQEPRRSDAKIAAILEIAADAIIALDADMRITQFNDGAVAIFGYAKDELIGRSLDLLIPERFRSGHGAHVRTFASAGVASRRMGERREIFALRKDGSEFPAEASIAQLSQDNERIYLVVLRDVTERKRTEALLAQSNQELEARVAERTKALVEESRRREEAQAALIQAQRMEAFGQLTGGVAHDFNNLLTIVLGNLERLEPTLAGKEERGQLQRASDAAQMGARLTARLLSFARRRPLAPSVLSVNDLVLDTAEILKRSLGEQITLTTLLAGNLWPTKADASEVENAVLNLAITLAKERVDLLFSDVGLGRGLSGFELGRWVQRNCPHTKVLLTTGYAANAAGEENARDAFPILHKPYTRLQLLVALHETLGAKS